MTVLLWNPLSAASFPDPNNEYLEHLATALDELKAGSCASAYQALTAAYEHRQDERLAYLVRAVILTQAGMYSDANKAFDEAADMGAEMDVCAYGKAICSLGLRDFSTALSVLPKKQNRVPNSEVRLVQAYISLMQGGHANLESLSGDPRVSLMTAYTLLKAGKSSEALPLLIKFPPADTIDPTLDIGVSMGMDTAAPISVAGGSLSGALVAHNKAPVTGYSGQLRLRANRAQTPSAGYVLFYVDDRLLGIVNVPPFEFVWDTSKVANGLHVVKIRGETADGMLVGESSQQVLVSNILLKPGLPVSGEAAEKIAEGAWQALRLRGSRTWAEYELARAAEEEGKKSEAMLHYERILAFRPFYRDVQDRWRALSNFTASAPVWKGTGTDGAVTLTFDDGPNGGTQSLLAALTAADIKAEFFLVGAQARRNPDLVRKIHAAGHGLACHSESHRSLTELDEEEFICELFGAIAIIHELTGKIPHYFRPPGGHLDARGRKIAQRFGLTPIMWSAHCGPYEGGPVRTMEDYVASNVVAGSILLMHNCEPTTLKALPGIVAGLKKRGLRIVTLSDLRK